MLNSNSFVRNAAKGLMALGLVTTLSWQALPAKADGYPSWHRYHDRAAPSGNIVEVLERDGRFGILLSALDLTGLKEVVATADPLTLFAPTDQAFGNLPDGTLEALVQDTNTLSQILLYHVLGTSSSARELIRSSTAPTLQSNPVLVLREGRNVEVNGRVVEKANVKADNGLIHVLGGVLLPPEEDITINSVVDVLKLDGRFETLLAALEVTGLTDAVAGLPSLSLFAPTDDAFNKLPEGTVEALIADTNTLSQILLYHVLGESQGIRHLLIGRTAETLQGDNVDISITRKGIFINDSRVINYNVSAPNGLIQTIDTVLLPPDKSKDLLELLKEDGRFTTLVTALELSGLDEAIGGEDPLTVTLFAPTDEAFDALPDGALEDLIANPDALAQILLYHVVDGVKGAGDLLKERRIETLQGSNVLVYHWWGKVFVNRSRVIDADLHAENGVVHAINAVLIPRE